MLFPSKGSLPKARSSLVSLFLISAVASLLAFWFFLWHDDADSQMVCAGLFFALQMLLTL